MSQISYDNSASVYLIPTPIGNMDDMTKRSIDALNKVEVIFSEDTRITSELLYKIGIKKKLISSNDHTEENNIGLALKYLKDGINIGIVTDRGTPIISDPGYRIAKACIESGFNVIPLPGANALIPALISSGINPSPFIFYGFLNSKKSKREKELELLKNYPMTIIFYEAPHRIIDMLDSLKSVFGNRNISVAREISKLHEEIYRGTIEDVIIELNSQEIKGEFVIVVSGKEYENNYERMTIEEHVKLYLDDGLEEKEALKKVAKDRGVSKSDIYKEYHLNK